MWKFQNITVARKHIVPMTAIYSTLFSNGVPQAVYQDALKAGGFPFGRQ